MAIPPIIGYIVLAGFALGILAPLFLAAIAQRRRPGAIAGVAAGSLLSIPAGLLCGMLFWSLLEEATPIPEGLLLFIGPLIGCFFGTFSIALLTREVGATVAATWDRHRKHHTTT